MRTEQVNITDPETDEEYTINAELFTVCEHCEYEWATTSDKEKVTCPSCDRKTKTDNTVKSYTFFSKQTCWISEQNSVNDYYELFADLLELDKEEITLHVNKRGTFYVGILSSNVLLPILYRGTGIEGPRTTILEREFITPFNASDISELVDYWTRGELEDVLVPRSEAGDIRKLDNIDEGGKFYPSPSPERVEPYIENMRYWADKMEAMKKNGWVISDSNGEHIRFTKREI